MVDGKDVYNCIGSDVREQKACREAVTDVGSGAYAYSLSSVRSMVYPKVGGAYLYLDLYPIFIP